MNFGTYELQRIIYSQLVRGNVDVHMSGGRNKFSKDLAKTIYEFILENSDMQIDMKEEAKRRGISDAVIRFSDRAGKALGFAVMPLDPVSVQSYEWIIEQEKSGQTIEKFAEWAKREKAEYIRMYRKTAENIRIDWGRAFGAIQPVMLAGEERI